MKSKSLMMLALLAAAPVASQAAVVEMNDAELSAVEGQAFSYAWNLNPALGFGFSNSPTTYGYGYTVGVTPTVSYTAVNDLNPARNVSYGTSFAFGKSTTFVRNK
jgi:hypothetical protein